jgi:hypothetical protein
MLPGMPLPFDQELAALFGQFLPNYLEISGVAAMLISQLAAPLRT